MAAAPVTEAAADGFQANAQATPAVGPQAPVEGASAGELWGARGVPSDGEPLAAQKPSFEGVTVRKDRHGNLSLGFTVRQGDTLSALSRRSGVDVDSLARFNQIQNPSLIHVGQKVEIPTTFHEVKKGDTYYAIARQTGISPQLLMKLNNAPPDGLLRVGQEIRVPASIVGEAQKQLRADLISLIDNAGKAQGKMYFGEGSFPAYHVGNDLGFSGVADSDSRFEFSDDFKSVKVSHGQSDAPPTEYKLEHPVEDLRRILNTDVIRAVASIRQDALKAQFPEFPGAFNVVGPRHHEDGTVGFTLTGPADGDTWVSYDPKQATLTLTDNSDRVVTLPAKRPAQIVEALQAHFRLKLPLYA